VCVCVRGHGEEKPQHHSRLGRKLNNVDVTTEERKDEEELQGGGGGERERVRERGA
jgi:hypothetical protein